jgi:hypothetical protein
MDEFMRTPIGRKFLDGTMPRIASALERIAEQLEIVTVLVHATLPQKPAERADRIATLSVLYPDLTVAQLEFLDGHATVAAERENPDAR